MLNLALSFPTISALRLYYFSAFLFAFSGSPNFCIFSGWLFCSIVRLLAALLVIPGRGYVEAVEEVVGVPLEVADVVKEVVEGLLVVVDAVAVLLVVVVEAVEEVVEVLLVLVDEVVAVLLVVVVEAVEVAEAALLVVGRLVLVGESPAVGRTQTVTWG